MKPIITIAVSALIVAATGGMGIFAGSQIATAWASTFGTGLGAAAATGALAGAAGGAIMTGTIQGTLKGALFGAISAGVAYGIGETFGHAGGIFTKGVKVTKAFGKALAHGISRGAISMAQGGTFRAGFASGFASSFFNPGTALGGDGVEGFTLRTTIAGVVGGTASELGGGKFANGAVSGAFVHMFNGEGAVKLFVKHIHSFFRSKISVVLDDAVLDTAKASRSANTLIYKKDGTFETAIKEFESLAVDSSIKIHRNGSLRTGVMENGETISVRNFSSGGDITLQMSSGGNHIKIRYSGLARLPDDSIEAGFLLF